jgi:MHS family proline/betaine transporter-like MFS transporter
MAEAKEQTSRSETVRVIAAGAIGNVIEWYDFALYGYMAVVISQLFFPHEIKAVALIATFATFAAGFLMRPIGATVFGYLGDVIGRKYVLIVSVIAMVVPTTLLGVLPTYADIGIGATVLIVILRLVQGLSVGGEFAGSVTYLIEMAPPDRRAFVTSWTNVGGQFGMLLGAATPTAVIYIFGTDAFNEWSWRLPFLAGGILGVIALILRSMVPEPKLPDTAAEPRRETHRERYPLVRAFKYETPVIVKTVFYCMGYGILFYITMVYLPTWLSEHTPMHLHEALLIITLVMIPQSLVIPMVALASDKFLKRTHLLAAAYFLSAVVAFPLFWWASGGGGLPVGITIATFALIVAFPLGITPALLAEAFDRGHRLSGYSLSFNTGMALGGGTAPMIATLLIHVTGDIMAPAYYLIFGSLIAAIALCTKHDRSRELLR